MLDPRAGLAVAVDDARYRVISTLGTSGAVQGVDRTFAVLANAVRSGDQTTVRDAIAGATGTLNALERSAPETDAVEVAALRLVLLNAEALFPAR
jgi:Tfp pilus assembly pilus retraction ATPase PilT